MKNKCKQLAYSQLGQFLIPTPISDAKMAKLKTDLQRNETERESQLMAMRSAYEDFKVYTSHTSFILFIHSDRNKCIK